MNDRRSFLFGALAVPLLTAVGPWQLMRKATAAAAQDPVPITMLGTPRVERVWFEPQGLWVAIGQTVRFINKDPANVHSATTFHPDLYGHERRIPAKAKAWNSDLLLPDAHFDLTLQIPGFYDYYCLPHLAHGMVGRIVVGTPEDVGWTEEPYYQSSQLEGQRGTFPEVQALLTKRVSPTHQ